MAGCFLGDGQASLHELIGDGRVQGPCPKTNLEDCDVDEFGCVFSLGALAISIGFGGMLISKLRRDKEPEGIVLESLQASLLAVSGRGVAAEHPRSSRVQSQRWPVSS